MTHICTIFERTIKHNTMKAQHILIFAWIAIGLVGGLLLSPYLHKEQETHTTYQVLVTGTVDGGYPCSWEVWKATVPADHPDLDLVDEDYWEYNGDDHWDRVYSTSICYKYDNK